MSTRSMEVFDERFRETVRRDFEARYVPVPESGCWLFDNTRKSKQSLEYGAMYVRTGDGLRQRLAHRISYQLNVGPLRSGDMVCHKCDVPSCVNPNHLFAGSQRDNMHDMQKKGRQQDYSRQARGEQVGGSKLTKSQAREIKGMAWKLSSVRVAKKYGISPQMVRLIWHGTWWAWL